MTTPENPHSRSEANSNGDNDRLHTTTQLNPDESKYKYEQLLNSIDEGYCVINVMFDDHNKAYDYCILEVNPAFEKQTNLVNATGKCISAIAPANESYWFDIYGQVALTGNPVRIQRWATEFNRQYDVYAFRIGQPGEMKVAVLFSDITSEHRAENNLAFLFDMTKNLISISGLEETIQIIGAKLAAYLGLCYVVFAKVDTEKSEVEVTYNWHSPHLPDIKGTYFLPEYISYEVQHAYMQGNTITVDNTETDAYVNAARYKALQIGSFITIPLKRNSCWQFFISFCRSDPHVWRSDEIALVQEAASSIWTNLERKQMERDLFYSEERLRLAVEAANIGICDLDYKTGETLCNEMRYTMYGMTPKAGRTPLSTFLDRTHPDDLENLHRTVTTALEAEGKYTVEFRTVHPDGTIWWISATGKVTEWEDGKPRRVVSTLIDITSRKTEEKQRDDFFNIASHELKTPVTNIKAITFLLEETFRENENSMTAELGRQLDRQVERLDRLISNMLDASKAAIGRLDYQKQSIHIIPLLKEVVKDLQHTTKLHRLILSTASLPPLFADGERLMQVFSNIISNAIKYTPHTAQPALKDILIETCQVGQEVRIAVTDGGIGMSAGTLPRLFQRFFRSDAPENHYYPGLGLGLYISLEIMKYHGGTIEVKSVKGKGSTFTMILPLTAETT